VRYWWVNHKQTVRQEIDGGYLWSPKETKNGRRSQFYVNMTVAGPGDGVLSYADGQIAYVGRVTRKAYEGPKPTEYGPAGETWNDTGWRLPVKWKKLPQPIRPSAHFAGLRHLLPEKYSPLSHKTGGGNQGAYLAEIPPELFHLLIGIGGTEWAVASGAYAAVTGVADPPATYNVEPAATEKQQPGTVRIGQGLFRTRIRQFERGCRLTGISNPRLLVASHIKPWRDSSHAERVDGANGLLLTPHVDRLFDRGLITFLDNGDVRVSTRLPAADLQRLGLATKATGNTGPFHPAQLPYLDWHRRHCFHQ
jgi:hypothetical protein